MFRNTTEGFWSHMFGNINRLALVPPFVVFFALVSVIKFSNVLLSAGFVDIVVVGVLGVTTFFFLR